MTQPDIDQQLPAPQQYEQSAPPYYGQNSPESVQGAEYERKATTYAVIGLFVLGFVFGPMAIVNANRAQALGTRATLGKVMGWCVTISSYLFVVLFIIFALVGAATAGSMHKDY
ncbi:hypothetical protein FCN77_02345 [Arthrobacter sp. 24S4-2]|uniref:hypothetical protein n=1 Tax=Arthrobacter sp. 24S4-2 TaxID=2575374 RepID=UPI0010C776C6|nr:hypothetical protein [Arthrobacter sp. 24S4-2]QCO96770.1 hypothetical protein FCN77_02345 [Arthrobacter sp. 24S4-2]